MKQKIQCPCNNIFFIEYQEEINLDINSDLIEQMMDGTFMNYKCSKCGKNHKPEFPISVIWDSKKIKIEVLPETERGEFYRRKKDPQGFDTIISYPEMAERVAVLRDDLEPVITETIKSLLFMKANESYPENDISVWYQHKAMDILEFHIHGIRKDEVAISQIPMEMYQNILADYKKKPRAERFASLKHRSYLSLQNILRPEELK
ncbi:MAG: CpXC domain-containing protein [Treponema sp.]|jgi:hypothetical protein|nr:CpXC domain-containing protein [Treponema sp.]